GFSAFYLIFLKRPVLRKIRPALAPEPRTALLAAVSLVRPYKRPGVPATLQVRRAAGVARDAVLSHRGRHLDIRPHPLEQRKQETGVLDGVLLHLRPRLTLNLGIG